MRKDVWDNLVPQLSTESNTIYVKKFGCDVVPGDFIVFSCRRLDSCHLKPHLEGHEIGRIIRRSNKSPNDTAFINIYQRTKYLPSRIQRRIGPLSTPSTQYLGELVQTTQVRHVNRDKICRFAYVFHNEILAATDSMMYLHGMLDCYVIRYKYNAKKDM